MSETSKYDIDVEDARIRTPLDVEMERRENQRAFARQWQAAHPRAMWLPPWVCPLCRKAIQDIPANEHYQPHDVEAHQNSHGESWKLYVQAANHEAHAGGGGE